MEKCPRCRRRIPCAWCRNPLNRLKAWRKTGQNRRQHTKLMKMGRKAAIRGGKGITD